MIDTTQQSTAPVETSTSDASESTEDEALGTYEQRVQSAYDEIREEESAAKGGDADSTPTPAETPNAKSGSGPDLSKAREERAARLAKLMAAEAAAVEEQGRRAAPDKAARAEMGEMEELRAAAARAKELEAVFADEEAFFRYARGRVSPERLAEHIRSQLEDPSRAAAEEARRALSPEMHALKQQLDAQNAQIAELLRERQSQAVESVEQQAQDAVMASLDAGKETMPLSAGFVAKHGRNEFLKLVYAAADRLPEGSDEQALLDTVEAYLEQLVGFVPAPATQATPSRATPPAAAKAKTLSNSLASARASVVEDEEDFVEDYNERVRRAAESLFG